tara:strand:- start:431 stop:1081 length:651 start_codon:yes stop_codon:yes gene_type:complete
MDLKARLETHTLRSLKYEVAQVKKQLNYSKLKKDELIKLMLKHKDLFGRITAVPEGFKHVFEKGKRFLEPTKKKEQEDKVKGFFQDLDRKSSEATANIRGRVRAERNEKARVRIFNEAIKVLKDGTKKQKDAVIDFFNTTANNDLFEALEFDSKYIKDGIFVKGVLTKPLKLREALLTADRNGKGALSRDVYLDLEIPQKKEKVKKPEPKKVIKKK